MESSIRKHSTRNTVRHIHFNVVIATSY